MTAAPRASATTTAPPPPPDRPASRRRRRWRGALGLALLLALAVLVVPPLVVELSPPPAAAAPPPLPSIDATTAAAAAGPFAVYVADWGYHTSIVFAQPAGWRLGPPGREAAPFVEYAWGDRRFYMESDFRPHALFATLFLPTDAVAYVAGRDAAPREGVDGARAVYVRRVSAAELTALATVLEGSIRRASPGAPRPGPHPATVGYEGRFYPAYGAYLWWSDCNRWTVARLHDAGLASGGRGVVLSGQVRGRLRGFAEPTR